MDDTWESGPDTIARLRDWLRCLSTSDEPFDGDVAADVVRLVVLLGERAGVESTKAKPAEISGPVPDVGDAGATDADGSRLGAVFHKLWGKATESPGYCKAEWRELQTLLERAGWQV